jgi:hypothetical protein
MVVSKLDIVIVASIAVAMIWIEHGQRISIEAPLPTVVAAPEAVCPENESVPHSADCFAFEGADAPELGARLPARPDPAGARDSVCPANNENVPYSAECLRFMSGGFWRSP